MCVCARTQELVSSIQDVKNAAAAACESLTYEEAEELGAALKKLTPAQLQAAVQVVAARQPAALQLSQMQVSMTRPQYMSF